MDYRLLIMKLAKGELSLQEVYNELAKQITEQVGSTRASLWLFNASKDAIVLQALYDTRTEEFASGSKLTEDDFPQYFEAIRRDLRVIAPAAHTHPATSCFSELYFEPLGIESLLDLVILNAGEPAAVLCCEHCGEQKQWSDDDMVFLEKMAAAFSMTFKYKSNG